MYLFPNGDFFVCGSVEYHLGLPDSEARNIALIDSNGFYDTSFNHDAYGPVSRFHKYDENRLLITGNFTAYDSVPLHRIARIFNDGSIDTTFNSIFEGASWLWPQHVQPDGKIIMGGGFYVQGFDKMIALARLYPDGSLDSTFNNFNNVQSELGLLEDFQNDTQIYFTRACCPTKNNKYLVGGHFDYYQGYNRGHIALTDENGFLDTTILSSTGIDTALGYPYPWIPGVNIIIPAQNNKYYVAGGFSGFNGQMVEPIIRLNPHDHVGIEEQDEEQGLLIYPNPAKETLLLQAGSYIENAEVFSIEGRKVKKIPISGTQKRIDVSVLPPGNYILRATGRDKVWAEKFVVMR